MKATVLTNRKQKGAVLVFTALSLFVIIGAAGLALDLADDYANLTRLQNSIDSAALAAAQKLLKDIQDNVNNPVPAATVSTANANLAGKAAYLANLNDFSSHWLSNRPSAENVQFCWSTDLQDFSGCSENMSFAATTVTSTTAFYVRASLISTPLPNFIMQALALGGTRSVGAVAVAGTAGYDFICNVAPFFVCDTSPAGTTDEDCQSDTTRADGTAGTDDKADCFGNPVTLASDDKVDPTHFFAIKAGSSFPPATPVSTSPHDPYDCHPDNLATPEYDGTLFETNGCTILKDQRADNVGTTFDESSKEGFPVVINKATQRDWAFNGPQFTLNGNFGFLELVDINNEQTNSGLPAVKTNLLTGDACIKNAEVQSQPGNMVAISTAANALFGEPGNLNDLHLPLGDMDYADHVGKGRHHKDQVIFNPTYSHDPPDPAFGVVADNIEPHEAISYNFYKRIYESKGYASGIPYHKRLMNVPVIECPTTTALNGNETNLPVAGYACFFLNRKMKTGSCASGNCNKSDTYGQNADPGRLQNNEDWIIAEHVDRSLCPPTKGVGQGEVTNILQAFVVLYQYYQSKNS